MGYRPRRRPWAIMTAALLVACGGEATPSSPTATAGPVTVQVAVLNSELLIGVDRISVALFDAHRHPITNAQATVELDSNGTVLETRPLQAIGSEYGGIPIYVGVARFPAVGTVTFSVHATLKDGRSATGKSSAVVTDRSNELPVRYKVPAQRQPILGDPGVTIGTIDSGVPPDAWHTATIADGLAQHKPMVLFFGEPGFCKSQTCGPTVQVLQRLCATYCGRFLFEHIEDHYPAGPDETAQGNPTFDAFSLRTDPWVYFVNADGVVADRFEGPVTVEELSNAADGTLAGKVPAVDITVGG